MNITCTLNSNIADGVFFSFLSGTATYALYLVLMQLLMASSQQIIILLRRNFNLGVIDCFSDVDDENQ